MAEAPSRLRVSLVSLAVLPLLIFASQISLMAAPWVLRITGQVDHADLGDSMTRSLMLDHLVLIAGINALLLVPANLLLARLGARLSWTQLGFHSDRAGRATALGAGLGLTVLLVPAFFGWLVGGLEFVPKTPQSEMIGSLQKDTTLAALLLLPGLALAAFSEELLIRGLLLRLWSERIGQWPALIFSSAFFALLHSGNPDASVLGALGAFIAGLWLGVAFLASRSLLLATGLHLGWNAGVAVVLGLPVSGLALPSLLRLIPNGQVDSTLWWGGDYGPEEGLAFHIALLAATLMAARWGRRLKLRE